MTTTTTQPTITIEDFRAEVERRGGRACGFVCPLCGNVATGHEFAAAGAEARRVAQECIGRVTGANGGLYSKVTPMPQPCDWAAFGLFGTLGKGQTVVYPDGKQVGAFAFAEVAQ